MGTVRGDLHDIGKNLVCMMAEGAGFEVHDIGVDQSVEKFMAAADKCQPDDHRHERAADDDDDLHEDGDRRLRGGRPRAHQDGDRRRADQPDVRRRDRRRRLRPERVGGRRSVPAARRRSQASRAWRREPVDAIARDEHLQDPLLAGNSVADQASKTTPERGHASSSPPRSWSASTRLAQQRGLTGADDYLAQWQWSEEQEREARRRGRRRGGEGGTGGEATW